MLPTNTKYQQNMSLDIVPEEDDSFPNASQLEISNDSFNFSSTFEE